jgi:hypothetical protein
MDTTEHPANPLKCLRFKGFRISEDGRELRLKFALALFFGFPGVQPGNRRLNKGKIT